MIAVMIIGAIVTNHIAPEGGPGVSRMLLALAASALVVPAILVLVGLIGGAAVYKTVVSPLADVMAASEAVAEGDLSVRVDPSGMGEVRHLGESFNRMTSELELSDQRRRNLTADVAHELRTPLQLVQGNLEGILDRIYEPSDERIEATLAETRQLARLIDDLRTLSLAESGDLTLVVEPINVGDLFEDVTTSFGGQAEAAGIHLEAAVSEGVAQVGLRGDEGRLNQVLGNLVANALRYTPEGGAISLLAQVSEVGVRLTVADTGSGIVEEDLPFLFDRFWRGDRARTRRPGVGSGLGLPISRQLVRLHGGTIRVISSEGEGTTFVIELPVYPALDAGDS
jgi:signal transduction histidine kinase